MNTTNYFNTARAKSLATIDESGQPNVCLCGTAFMPDENTIYIGNAFLDRTRENIRRTKKATFMASKQVEPDYWKHFEKTGEKLYPAGFRYYCTLIEETDNQEILEPIYQRLKSRKEKQ